MVSINISRPDWCPGGTKKSIENLGPSRCMECQFCQVLATSVDEEDAFCYLDGETPRKISRDVANTGHPDWCQGGVKR